MNTTMKTLLGRVPGTVEKEPVRVPAQTLSKVSAGGIITSSKRDDLILKELKQLSSSIGNIESRVSKLESDHMAEHRAESPMDWAVRGLAKEEGHLRPGWSDSEEGEVHTISLSEHNVDLLSSSFSSTLSNSELKKVRNSFPAPDVLQTHCPWLDSVFKTSARSWSKKRRLGIDEDPGIPIQ